VGVGKSVTILGAGIAGMTTAFEMSKLGYTCTILEASDRAGGRCQTIRAGDVVEELDSTQICNFDTDDNLYFNPGPARIPHHHKNLLQYCRSFNVALEPFINDNRAALFHQTSAFGGAPQTARQVKADIRGYIASLLTDATNSGALDARLNATDRANLTAMLSGFGALDTNGNYSGSTRNGFIEPADQEPNRQSTTPALSLTDLLRSDFWQYQSDFSEGYDQQTTMLQPVGGMDRIAIAFEQRVENLIQYSRVVSAIRKTTNGVLIEFQDGSGNTGTIESDYCVCTIPASVLSTLASDFSAVHQEAIDNFAYSKAVKVAFQSRRFWEEDHNIYGGISWTDQDITQTWYPSNGFGSQQGVILGAYTFSDSAGQRFTNMNPTARFEAAVSEGTRIHPEYGAEVSNGISVSWLKKPLQLGAWGVSDPGVLLTNDDNIYFAGEHLSILQGWQEGAILSAYHAINGIVTIDIN
jgi:monoamine oxidase